MVSDAHRTAHAWSPAGSLEQRVSTVVIAAVEVLDVDSVGAMLLDAQGHLRLLGASDELARLLEEAQIDVSEGPGIQTTRTGADVAVADLATVTQWPALALRLRDAGAGAVLSAPILASGVVVGNLNSILRRAHVWTPAEIRSQRAYARLIGAMLSVAAPSGSGRSARRSDQSEWSDPIARASSDKEQRAD
jgi:GAF domain-containing protein